MRRLDIYFAAKQNLDAQQAMVVVIDVLRATSTMVTALSNGCNAILPVTNLNEALSTAARMKDVLLAGERNARKPAHFDLGNSPLEFTREAVNGKTIVFSTTNGTRALRSIQNANEIILASFLNFQTVVSYLKRKDDDVIFYCAGNNGAFSLEDTLCATLLIYHLVKDQRNIILSDAGKWSLHALREFVSAPDDIREKEIGSIVSEGEHARKLKTLNLDEDIAYCCRLNRIDLIPYLNRSNLIVTKDIVLDF